MRVAFQMDPIEGVDIDADSTFRIAEEAQARGHAIYYYPPDALRFERGEIRAMARSMTLRRKRGDHVSLGAPEDAALDAFDVVWLRQDPPFDINYVTTTHLLDHVHPTTLVVNDPFWVRNFPEKILVLKFPELIPDTLVTRDLAALKAFKAAYPEIVVKPLFGHGGAGVFRLGPHDRNLAALYETMTMHSREQLIAQEYLPAIENGDKRIILVDGEAAGAINRVPQPGETRSNMHVGGRAEPATLTKRDLEICAAIGPTLRDHGQILVGIDVIGDKLTEINVTSPTGLQELERFDGVNVAARIWDVVEARRAG
jgi:glutathione synthase